MRYKYDSNNSHKYSHPKYFQNERRFGGFIADRGEYSMWRIPELIIYLIIIDN